MVARCAVDRGRWLSRFGVLSRLQRTRASLKAKRDEEREAQEQNRLARARSRWFVVVREERWPRGGTALCCANEPRGVRVCLGVRASRISRTCCAAAPSAVSVAAAAAPAAPPPDRGSAFSALPPYASLRPTQSTTTRSSSSSICAPPEPSSFSLLPFFCVASSFRVRSTKKNRSSSTRPPRDTTTAPSPGPARAIRRPPGPTPPTPAFRARAERTEKGEREGFVVLSLPRRLAVSS